MDGHAFWILGHAKGYEHDRQRDRQTRGDGTSAAGMAIWAYTPDHGRVILVRAGRCLHSLRSAFVSEIMALEWGLDEFVRFFLK